MAPKRQLYEAVPLEKQSSNIRLLRVYEANALEDPLICELEVDYLDRQAAYAALSYTWGTPIFDHRISCNKRILDITKDLDHALRLFRRRFAGQRIWVDQICIDQHDLSEKSSQITMMSKIYTKASHVLVYLGSFDATSLIGVKLARDVKTHSAQITASAKKGEDLSCYIPSANHPAWKAWSALFYREWWSRVWVIQEAVSNSSALVLCEGDAFDWSILPSSFFFLSNLMEDYPALFNPLFAFMKDMPKLQRRMYAWKSVMSAYNNSNSAAMSLQLGETLDMIRTFSASNPLDKIYAILGIIEHSSQAPTPNYKLPPERVYQDFAEYLCLNSKPFLVLSVAGMKKVLPNLPTWVPDWTCDTQGLSFERVHGFGYCAGGESRAILEHSKHPSSILIRAALIDEIVAIGPVRERTQPLEPIEFIRDYVFWTLCSWELIDRNENFKSLTLQARLEMFSRLISADCPHIKHLLEVHAAYFTTFYSGLSPQPETPNPFEMHQHSDKYTSTYESDMMLFSSISSRTTKTRKVCMTSKGYIGLAPDLTEVGDKVCIFQGAKAPFILRNVADAYNVVGDAFILNLMKGEAWELNDFVLSLIRLQ